MICCSLQVESFFIVRRHSHQQQGVILFTTEVDALAAPTFASVMCVASPVAVAIYTSGELPKLWAECISTVTNITIIARPVVFSKLDITIKAILLQIKSFISFTQFHFSIPRPVVESLKTLYDQLRSLSLFVYF